MLPVPLPPLDQRNGTVGGGLERVIDLAEEKGIDYQFSFLKSGATDAGVIHLTGMGAPSLFLGVATRHIHSHHGILDLDDVEATIQLLLEAIQKLNWDTVNSFTSL